LGATRAYKSTGHTPHSLPATAAPHNGYQSAHFYNTGYCTILHKYNGEEDG